MAAAASTTNRHRGIYWDLLCINQTIGLADGSSVGRFSIYIILTGILLVLASSVPVVHTLYRMAVAEPVVIQLPLDEPGRWTLSAVGVSEIMLVLSVEFATGEGPYNARYAYRISSLTQTLQQGSGMMKRDTAVGIGGLVKQSTRIPVLRLKSPEHDLEFEIEIGSVADDSTSVIVGAQAEVTYDPPRFRISFVTAVVLWTIGILFALIGAIQWVRSIAAVPVQVDSDLERGRFWCVLCHLGALVGYILPFGHIVAPLIIWMNTRDKVAGVDEAGRESINFQLTVTLFALIGVMLSAVFIGLVLLFMIVVFHVSMTLYASLRAQRGGEFRYPLNLRMIKQGTAANGE